MDTLFRFPDINGPFRGSHALADGWLTGKQLRSTLLTRLFRDVYVPRGMEVTHQLRCLAASLIAPASAVLTGWSAAAIRGFDLAGAGDPVEFVVPEADKFVAQRGLDVRRTELKRREHQPWHTIQIASPVRTALDLLLNVRLRRSLPRTVGMLDVLLRAGFVDAQELRNTLTGRHDNGIVRARTALEMADPRAESIPESEVRVWLTLAGIAPQVQVEVFDELGRFVARLDLAYERCRLAVEYDGAWHGEADQPWKDAERRARLRALGWEFIIVTNEDMRRGPERVVDAVREALRRRSAHGASF